ncbi:MAG: iron-sulfur cluster-binding protein [Luteitalea sp.]|nr:iron-sulfur cluster-binding protein [Luteitalea sp.]
MTNQLPFYRRVEQALGDTRLRDAVQRATSRKVEARLAALASMPDADDVRDHGRRIRADALAHLDQHLTRFVEQVERHGGTAVWAATAEEAVGYVVHLARARGVKSIVKSKSMVTEEIELNRAVEAAGLRIIETDLGEYVVQLDHDHPSHIVAPIIHKTRQDVAATFKRELGATDEDVADIPSMTAFARHKLRQDFLTADMGVSGVNFGVAETGTLCLCTNEGNGRLTTTLPRIHVAVMGIERIVPTLGDLGVMLQLLARSGTGQKLTVYSNLLTGPRRPDDASTGASGEGDGPDELHVVLVDNGRSRVLGSELAEVLYCIRCGACLNVCPVYRQIGGHAYGSVYQGPIGAVFTPATRGLDDWGELPHASSLCGACREVCPVRIDIPRMLLALRAQAVTRGDAPWWLRAGLRAYRLAAVRPALFRLGGRWSTRLMRWAARNGRISKLPGPLAGWTRFREFPAMAPRTFQDRWRERAR